MHIILEACEQVLPAAYARIISIVICNTLYI